jgi:hypothetical protein
MNPERNRSLVCAGANFQETRTMLPRAMVGMGAMVGMLLASASASAAEMTFLSWSVDTGHAIPAVVCQQLADMPPAAIYALVDVGPREIDRYAGAIRKARGGGHRHMATWSGGRSRVMISYDSEQLQLLESRELFQFDGYEMNDWRHRSPLACLFEHRRSGEQFWFVAAHLARADAVLRRSQSRGLRAWARRSKKPVVAMGVFNFDYDFVVEHGNQSYDYFIQGGDWSWAQPSKVVDTHWTDRDGDGVDDYPNSCLDFAFHAKLPKEWKLTSEVVVRANDFPDTNASSNHRPIQAKFILPGPAIRQETKTRTPTS